MRKHLMKCPPEYRVTHFCAKSYALAHNAMRGQRKRDKTKVKTYFKTKVKTELKRFSEYRLVKTDLKQS